MPSLEFNPSYTSWLGVGGSRFCHHRTVDTGGVQLGNRRVQNLETVTDQYFTTTQVVVKDRGSVILQGDVMDAGSDLCAAAFGVDVDGFALVHKACLNARHVQVQELIRIGFTLAGVMSGGNNGFVGTVCMSASLQGCTIKHTPWGDCRVGIDLLEPCCLTAALAKLMLKIGVEVSMKTGRVVLTMLLGMIVVGFAAAQDGPPAGGNSIVGTAAQAIRPFNNQFGSVEKTAVSGQVFTEVWRATSLYEGQEQYRVQIVFPIDQSIQRGDTLFARFYMRTLESAAESGEAKVQLDLEKTSEPRDKSGIGVAQAGSTWRLIELPFQSLQDYGAGKAQVTVRMGFGRQKLELAAFSFTNYKTSRVPSSLPVTRFDYEGRAADAAWRQQAMERIERIRKAALTVLVIDRKGKPVPGALVGVQQTRQAFGFGSALSGNYITGDKAATPDGQRYREQAVRLFNFAVAENDMKWPAMEGKNAGLAEDLLRWANGNGMQVRGHTLVWERADRMPANVAPLLTDSSALRVRIDEHITQVVGQFAGRLREWDVQNEPYTNRQVRNVLGETAVDTWLQQTRRLDPQVKLFINEFDIHGNNDQKLREFAAYLGSIKQRGTPLDGAGTQCHMGSNPPSIEKLLASFDALAAPGLEVVVTEYDMETTDQQLYADYTRDCLTAAFSHPAVTGFVMWGFWDGKHWKNNAPLFALDWTPKPGLQVWEDLVLGAWRTKLEQKTDAAGKLAMRAFMGEYTISGQAGKLSGSASCTVGPDGTTVQLVLE